MKNGYSRIETKILKALKRSKELTISQLVEHVYDEGKKPAYACGVVRMALGRLNAKVHSRKEGEIFKGERDGPHEIPYWFEPRA